MCTEGCVVHCNSLSALVQVNIGLPGSPTHEAFQSSFTQAFATDANVSVQDVAVTSVTEGSATASLIVAYTVDNVPDNRVSELWQRIVAALGDNSSALRTCCGAVDVSRSVPPALVPERVLALAGTVALTMLAVPSFWLCPYRCT